MNGLRKKETKDGVLGRMGCLKGGVFGREHSHIPLPHNPTHIEYNVN